MNYIKWELVAFFSNRKNLILYAILVVTSLYYAVYIAQTYQPIESVNKSEIQARYNDRKEFLKGTITEGTHPNAVYAYLVYPEWNRLDGERLSALADGNLQSYAQATHEWYKYSDGQLYKNNLLRYNPGYYTYGNMFATQDAHFAYLYSAERYGKYASANYTLNLNVFEERTALQTLQRMLESILPYVLLISCLLLCNDLVLKDRKHASIVNGFPMTPFKRMILKGFVGLIGSITSIVLFFPAFLVIGFRDGFGSLRLPAVIHHYNHLNLGTFDSISIGLYLTKNFVMLLFWFILIIGLVLLISIILKNEYINLTIGVLFFLEITYYQRGNIIEDWLGYLPTSYVQSGEIISGHRNYFLVTESLGFGKGLLVLLSTVFLIYLLIWLVTNKKKMTI